MNQAQTFDNFAGGITDNVVDCEPNQSQALDNFTLTEIGKLRVRPGSRRDNSTYAQVPNTPTRIGALIPFKDILFKQRSSDIHYSDLTGWNTLAGPTGNPALPGGTEDNFVAFSFWNSHTYITNDSLDIKPQKFYLDQNGDVQLRTAGLPALASDPSVSGTLGANAYLYRFLYKVSYVRDGNITFETRGPTTEVTPIVNLATINSGSPSSITGIPVLANGSVDNYDTATVEVEIYRTEANGQNFYLTKTVPNGTTSTTDGTADADLLDGIPIYTSGGVQENNPPPTCKFLHVTSRAAYYAYIKEGDDTFINEVRQSKPGQPDAVPASFSVQIEDEITGLSSVRDVPLVFGEKSIYRLDGILDDLGQGEIIPTRIADSIGCVSHNSIIQTLDAVFFAGTDGFYMTDGFKVVKLSRAFHNTYQTLVASETQRKRIYGMFYPAQDWVLWACNPDNESDNMQIFLGDFGQPRLPDGGVPFLTWNGKRLDDEYENMPTDWTATALALFQDKIYRAQADGYTMVHDEVYFTDERYTGSEWIQQPVQYDYKGPVTALGGAAVRKWIPLFSLVAQPRSNLSCLPQAANDFQDSYSDLAEIVVRQLATWGDSYWGDPLLYGPSGSLMNQKRAFPAGTLRCFYKQMRLRNAFTYITASDYRGAATVAGTTTKTVTLAGVQVFPPSCVDYYVLLAKSGGGYTSPLLITAQPADNQITVSDPDNEALAGSDLKWEMKGFVKGDGLDLISYSLYFKPLTPTQKPFIGQVGANDVSEV